ncbi:MAG: hypothetical protein ACTSQJ_18135 [Promethearchaeota archaeon]
MVHRSLAQKKYELNEFLGNLFRWIDSFKFDETPGHFAIERNRNKPSLYGLCDMIFNLVITNNLEHYLKSHEKEDINEWISIIQSYQNPKTGWIKEKLFNYNYHFKEHSTAFAISALKLLNNKPKFKLKLSKKLNSQKKVEKWLKNAPKWGLLYWPGSHRGGGIGAIYATLGPEYYPHEKFFDWYFGWLDKMADSKVGFWRIGWIHKIQKNRLTKHELGGAVHYYWVYEFMKHPIPYPEKVIDSVLQLQNDKGTWHKDFSYCIDLDAIFCLTRCCSQTKGYRKEEIKEALFKYMDFVINKINDKNFLFENYRSAHRLTGYLCALAELQKFLPHLFNLPSRWTQTLDITPWI